ncbi:MAG: transcriptional repressor LexA [Clostridia bacterium]|nr:transcriptional repressor LexA [Clostridia bacterium]
MTPLTYREKRVLDYISARFSETGYSPSVRDIKDAVGFKSTATVYAYIEKLIEKGYLRKDANKSRSLRPESSAPIYRVPVLGTVRAGQPILAYEECDGFVSFCSDGRRFAPDSLFALKITGMSMKKAGIMDGDTVIVEKTSYAENGEIVVVLLEDEATVKTFYKENGRYRLQPENDELEPIFADEVEVLGKVVANVRYY